MKTIAVLIVMMFVGASGVAQRVLALYNENGKKEETDFAKGLIDLYKEFASKNNFTIDVTSNLTEADLKKYDVVMWINDAPYPKKIRKAFEKYMENGGRWIGFQEVWQHEKGDKWSWFEAFMGAKGYIHLEPALPVRLAIDDPDHAVTKNLPYYITAPPNKWLRWLPQPRTSKDIKVLVTIDSMNYPLGIETIFTGGDQPVVWTNTKYNMIYLGMGHDLQSLSDRLQNQFFKDALMWVATKNIKTREAVVTNNDLPEMVKVQGGKFLMGDNAGDRDEKPAHEVTVSDFSIARTEVTRAQWRNFCLSTGRKMPEDPWFKQSEQHPVVNVSWDHATAYCIWLGDVTGKHYRLPTEAEWEFAARGGVKSKGFPYSGGKNADSVAWLGRKTEGTMPVAQKAPNELGLYDMTGNVWEWCSDWYAVTYYAVSEKDNPQGPPYGMYYTFRGGAWDIGVRNNRVTYRNPLAPMSRNHNKGFRVVCD